MVDKFCSEGLFKPIDPRVSVHGTSSEKSLCEGIAAIVSRVVIVRDLPLRAVDWQIEMAAGLLEGHDQMFITKTGDGKSFCYLLACMYDSSKIF